MAPIKVEPVLEVEELSVRVGEVSLVDRMSFVLHPGERVGMIGQSGAGKTLSALAVMGLLPPGLSASGRVRFQGKELLASAPPAHRLARGTGMAMVFQEPLSALNPVMMIGRQIGEVLVARRGYSRTEAWDRSVEWLDRVGILQSRRNAKRYPHQFSGGQRQRIMLAMALAGEPQLLIADEPTASLDAVATREIMQLIAELTEDRELALWLITHELPLISGVCDRGMVMNAGRMTEGGPTAMFFPRPQPPVTEELVDAQPTSIEEQQEDGLRPSVPRTYPEGAPFLEVQQVSHQYRPPTLGLGRKKPTSVLQDISLRLNLGERVGLVGRSGAGKTTLARLLVGIERAQGGRIQVGELFLPAAKRKQRLRLRTQIQLVFQDPMSSLDPRLRVAQTLSEPLHSLLPREEQPARVDELLSLVNLPASYGNRFVHQLSGGQRQRVAIARALAPSPQVLVADEPVSSLDPGLRRSILDLLVGLQQQRGIALLLISHDLALINHFCQRVLVLHHGRIVEQGEVERIFAQPEHPETQRLLSAVSQA